MSHWDRYVIDATMGVRYGMFAFCPIEGDLDGDYAIVTGWTVLSDEPPEEGKPVVAIVHEDGQEAVERFCEEHEAELNALREKLGG